MLHSMSSERTIEFGRHGQSDTNDGFKRIVEGLPLPPDLHLDKKARLTHLGEEQAYALGEEQAARLYDVPGKSIVTQSSDFERAIQTGKIDVARINANRELK